jgi:D-sedoheptulose 7-phosphate isomerase
MSAEDLIKAELSSAAAVLEIFRNEPAVISSISEAAALFSDALRNGNKAISCGNGGSMCDAMHFAEELTGRYRENRRGLAAISISDPSHMTCVGNDFGFDAVFSRYIEAVGRAGDVLLAISTSGNSLNILAAAEQARAQGIKVVALTGKGGGKLKGLADVVVNVAHDGYADRIQEIHIKVIHILILLIEKELT